MLKTANSLKDMSTETQLSKDTLEKLNKLKNPEQTYDELIQKLIKEYRDKEPELSRESKKRIEKSKEDFKKGNYTEIENL